MKDMMKKPMPKEVFGDSESEDYDAEGEEDYMSLGKAALGVDDPDQVEALKEFVMACMKKG